ncbi:MAG: FKBP-type peptidyl-prolyl cis-trans isomerase [Phycisphaerales bacterium]|nr:FKBP-type peptidyl-prolyl cis-trans isomerase [Phycisphaerales bacterium]
MRKISLILMLTLTSISLFAQKKNKKNDSSKSEKLETSLDSLSYALGFNFGANLASVKITNLNDGVFLSSMKEAMSNKAEGKLTKSEMAEIITNYITNQQQLALTKEKAEGEAFLLSNKSKKNIVTLASGVQYEVLKEGNGIKPRLQDTIKVDYKGMLLNGKVFDESYARKQPLEVSLNNLIPGWSEALQLMPVGSKWRLFIPSSLAYGDKGSGVIPGGATLIFEIELLDVKAKQ